MTIQRINISLFIRNGVVANDCNGKWSIWCRKTTISNKLLSEISNSMRFDPEEVGFMLRNIVPDGIKRHEAKTGDFQDLHLWKVLTVQIATVLVAKYKASNRTNDYPKPRVLSIH